MPEQNVDEIEVPTQYTDRRLDLVYPTDSEVLIRVTHLGAAVARKEQFAWVDKEELLDALAQIGWLPGEYRKPKPVTPREAKIREVATALANSDRYQDMTVEEYGESLGGEWGSSVYRANAEALIDAGLVQLDD